MHLFAALCYVPPSVLSSTAVIRWQEMLFNVSLKTLFSGDFRCLATVPFFLLNRVADGLIGLSCLAIAITLIFFIFRSGKLLPLRVPFIVLAVAVDICGVMCIAAAVLPEDAHVLLAPYVSLTSVLLALFLGALLPFVLPLVPRLLYALPQVDVAGSVSSVPSIVSPPASCIAVQPTPHVARHSLAASQQDDTRLLAATESSLDSFFIFEPHRNSEGKVDDFLFKWLNANGETLLQKSRAEIFGVRLTHLLPIDPAPHSFEQYLLVRATGEPFIHEFPLQEGLPYATWMRHHVVKLNDGIAITVTDITERRHSEQYLLHLTQHDALTGLPTRTLLDDRVVQAIARANRYRSKVAVFLIHLDSFQHLLKLHGLSVGDEIILTAASRLRFAIRSTDSVIRLGGDEFVVVMSDIILAGDIRRAAATLVAVLSNPISIADNDLEMTCSVGVSVYPDTAATVQDLLSGADVAMYRAKSHGNNQYALFIPANDEDKHQMAG